MNVFIRILDLVYILTGDHFNEIECETLRRRSWTIRLQSSYVNDCGEVITFHRVEIFLKKAFDETFILEVVTTDDDTPKPQHFYLNNTKRFGDVMYFIENVVERSCLGKSLISFS